MMNNTNVEIVADDKFFLHHVKFTILLILQIIGIVLCFVIFIYFTKNRAHLKALHNHGLFVLLVVNFIELVFDIPLSLSFYSHGYVNPPTASYCTWWTFFEYIITAESEYLLATISIQRHMFIFHQHVLQNHWKRRLLHTLPLVLCIVYPIIFYLFAIITYPCDNTQWDYTRRVCAFANCYLVNGSWLGLFDLLFNNSMPVVIDILANVIMILRVIIQKRRARQGVSWRQQRRMMLQLFGLSALYLTAWAPFLLVQIVHVIGNITFLVEVEEDYFADLLYITYFFLPWLWLGFFPELTKWIIQFCRRRRRVHNIVGTIQSRNTAATAQARNVIANTQTPHLETQV